MRIPHDAKSSPMPDTRTDDRAQKAMISMAHGLGKEVVAEGVETPAQAAVLRANGCEYLQGYLFGRPASAAQIEEGRLRLDARMSA